MGPGQARRLQQIRFAKHTINCTSSPSHRFLTRQRRQICGQGHDFSMGDLSTVHLGDAAASSGICDIAFRVLNMTGGAFRDLLCLLIAMLLLCVTVMQMA